jgi:hypothetical protein
MFSEKIFTISNDEEFKTLAIEVFNYQYNNLPIYKDFCDYLNIKPQNVYSLNDIPFLPINFFRTHKICSTHTYDLVFESSGTTSETTSKHYIYNKKIYHQSITNSFNHFYKNISNYLWIALTPDISQKPNSSLVYMLNYCISQSNYKNSGFYFNNFEKLYNTLLYAITNNIPTICMGLTYVLLDFAEKYKLPKNNNIIFIETGGMKGKRKELIREELHNILTSSLGTDVIHSEYGMTELLSQAYSKGNGIFSCPPWMMVIIRDTYNPFNKGLINKRGGINIIDLANIYSCAFIETEDLGIMLDDNTFKILGRIDHTIIRGCNTMIM